METRRLLALVDLFDPLPARRAADGISRLFKPPFKASGRLRDAQVMLRDVERRLGRFPDAKCFKKELLRREKRLGRQLERKLRRTRLKPLKNRMDALRKELRAAVKKADGRHRRGLRLLRSMDRAFANVVARRRSIVPAEPHATHRTRIAFKKFRYMVEQLRPLLPRLAGGLPGKLRGHQKLMGDIQDCETLLAALDKFMREEKSEARRLRQFRAAVKRDHARLMARYLRRADDLFSFWKPASVNPDQALTDGRAVLRRGACPPRFWCAGSDETCHANSHWQWNQPAQKYGASFQAKCARRFPEGRM